MRLQPNLDGAILRELNPNDMIVVTGESDNFYIVEAPTDLKAYIYRTFVLDGIVEGNRVNVRLEPDLNSHVIAQLNSGDTVQGTVLASDKKWLEITPPASARFYVAKEYVKNIGAPNLMASLQQKNNPTIHPIAEVFLTASSTPSQVSLNETPVLNTPKMSAWMPIEETLYTAWAEQASSPSIEAFYQAQKQQSAKLQGIIEPYNRLVKNRPGDYMLMHPITRQPIAYLYSTEVNLQDKVGQEVTVEVVARDNHHFAFPAYFVLSTCAP